MTPQETVGSELEVRSLLLLLVVLGCVGLVVELLLLDHFESWTQWVPLVVLAAGVGAAGIVWFRPARQALRFFRAMMLACIATGAAGLWLHFAGNRAFEVEMEPGQAGWLLAWHSLRGATPALAPGAMIQLGLLGLIVVWRHPALVAGQEIDPHTREDEP